MNAKILIQSSVDQLEQDLRKTKDPIKHAIISELLLVKKAEQERERQREKQREYNDMLLRRVAEEQEKSLNLLIKGQKKKEKLIKKKEERENPQKDFFRKTRGTIEDSWDIVEQKITPEYSQYIKQDTMNNRLMERLNSEIDFRLNENEEETFDTTKPFAPDNIENDTNDTTDTFAKFNINKSLKNRF